MPNNFQRWLKISNARKRKAQSMAAVAATTATATATTTAESSLTTAVPPPPPRSSSNGHAAAKLDNTDSTCSTTNEISHGGEPCSSSSSRRRCENTALTLDVDAKAAEMNKCNGCTTSSSLASSSSSDKEKETSSSPPNPSKETLYQGQSHQHESEISTTTAAVTRTFTGGMEVSSDRRQLDNMHNSASSSSSSSSPTGNDRRKRPRLMDTTTAAATATKSLASTAAATATTTTTSSRTSSSKEKATKRRDVDLEQQQHQQETEEERCSSNSTAIATKRRMRQRNRGESSSSTTTAATATAKESQQQRPTEPQENEAQTLLIQRLQHANAKLQKEKQQLLTRIKHLQQEANQLGQVNVSLQSETQQLRVENQTLLRQSELEQQRRHCQKSTRLQDVLGILAQQRQEMESALKNALCPDEASTSTTGTSTRVNNSNDSNNHNQATSTAASLPWDLTTLLLPPADHSNDDSSSSIIRTTANHYPVDSSQQSVPLAEQDEESNHSSSGGGDSDAPAAASSESKAPAVPKISWTPADSHVEHGNENNSSNFPSRHADAVVGTHAAGYPEREEEDEDEEEDEYDSFPDDFGETQAISGPFKLSAPDAASPTEKLPSSSAPRTTAATTIQSAENGKLVQNAAATNKAPTGYNLYQPSDTAELYCMPTATGSPLKIQQEGSTNQESVNRRKLAFEESSFSSPSQEDSQATREPVRATKSLKKVSISPQASAGARTTLVSGLERQSTIATMEAVVQPNASPLVQNAAPANERQSSSMAQPADDTRRRVTMENPYTKPLDPRSIGRPPVWNQRPLGNSTNAAHLPGSGWVSNQPARAFMKEMDDGVKSATTTTTTKASAWVSVKRHTNRNPHQQMDIWDESQPDYKYHEVVRCKAKRNALPCYDCPDCREFYECLRKTGHEFDAFDAPIDYSRHRSRFTPPQTPDDFWEIDFIDEKRAAEKAAMEARKQKQLAKKLLDDQQDV